MLDAEAALARLTTDPNLFELARVSEGINDQRGDLRVGVHVVTPTRLDHKDRALIEEFAKRTKAPAPHLAEFHQGLFSKLRDRFRNG